MKLNKNLDINAVFEKYPEFVKPKLLYLRSLILETAHNMSAVNVLEETLKWGEPSYLTKNGSTIRISWKKQKPETYALCFQCTSKLVPTFKTVYKNTFHFEGNRAIYFQLNDKIPDKELKHCISLALKYHTVKALPLLGA